MLHKATLALLPLIQIQGLEVFEPTFCENAGHCFPSGEPL